MFSVFLFEISGEKNRENQTMRQKVGIYAKKRIIKQNYKYG